MKGAMVVDDPRFHLRLTPALKKKLAHAAIENERSLNGEIVARLERSFKPSEEEQLIRALRNAYVHDDMGRVGEILRELATLIEKVRP
jgi:hypothetical protein